MLKAASHSCTAERLQQVAATNLNNYCILSRYSTEALAWSERIADAVRLRLES